MEDVAISESSESESESLPTTKLLDYGSIVFEKKYADNLKDLFLLKKPGKGKQKPGKGCRKACGNCSPTAYTGCTGQKKHRV
jgi:hypothetical protein